MKNKDQISLLISKIFKLLHIENKKLEKLSVQILKFVIVGGIATIIDWLVYYILFNYLNMNPLIANIFSFSVSVVYNYTASVKWIFEVDKNKSKKKIFVEFIVLSLIGLLLTEILLVIFINGMKLSEMLSKIIATAIVMVFNFITRKIFLEQDRKINFLDKKKDQITNYLNIFFSIILVISMNNYLDNKDISNNFLNIILLVSSYNLYENNKTKNKKEKIIPFIFGLFFSTMFIIGNVIYKYNDITFMFSSIKTLILAIISLIAFAKISGEITYSLCKRISKQSDKDSQWKIYKNKYILPILWIIIFISWIPSFLAYYPGISSYDAVWQTNQAMGGIKTYTKFHPPIHTMVWDICIKLGQEILHIEPLIIYSIMQMLIISFVFARLIKLLIDKKVNNKLILLSILFLSVNPVISIFSMIMTKDALFGALFVLFIIEVVKLVKQPKQYIDKPINWISYCLIGALTGLFRNNAIYAIILYTPVVLIVFKKYWKKLTVLLIAPIVLYYFVNNVVYSSLGIAEGDPREMLSVPIQQISSVANKYDKDLPEKTKEEINKYVSYDKALTEYNPRFADPMKSTFQSSYAAANKKAFVHLWLELLLKYPNDYISSALTLNLPYWYFDANTNDEYSKSTYIETHMADITYYRVERQSKLPWLLEKLKKVANYKYFEEVPILSLIFSVAMPVWIILSTGVVLLYKKQYKQIIILLPMLFLWLTYIAGPISIFRYVFPLFCLYPLLLSLMINGENYS